MQKSFITVDLTPFTPNGGLSRYGEEVADSLASHDDFSQLVCDGQFVAATAEMTKQQAQSFTNLLAESCFGDFDYFSWDGRLGPVVRIFMDCDRMAQIAELNRYGRSLQTEIDLHDFDPI
tara:strand:+ start:438 stop:797 length:360 start_codon:yes stop_codon:yes gene_type:complete